MRGFIEARIKYQSESCRQVWLDTLKSWAESAGLLVESNSEICLRYEGYESYPICIRPEPNAEIYVFAKLETSNPDEFSIIWEGFAAIIRMLSHHAIETRIYDSTGLYYQPNPDIWLSESEPRPSASNSEPNNTLYI